MRAFRKHAWRAGGLLGAFAVLLAGCGQALVARKGGVEPSINGERAVGAWVSGTEGVRYIGSYGLLEDEPRILGHAGKR